VVVRLRTLLFGLLLVTAFTKTEIHTIQALSETLAVVGDQGEGSLFLFDIDDTLIRGENEATDQWFRSQWTELAQRGLSAEEIKTILLPLYDTAQEKTAVKPVDEHLYQLLDHLDQKHVQRIVVTTRGRARTVTSTKRQFADLSLSFVQTKPGFDTEYTFPETGTCACYTDGILFADGLNKGVVLQLLFDRIGYAPTHIYFIDDSLKNVKDVELFAQQKGILFDGFYFTRVADELAKQ